MKERIALNNSYVKKALKNGDIIGVHWFRWADQITVGRQNDGENFGCGMVDICDTPVYDFVMSVRKLSEKMYKVRLSEKKQLGERLRISICLSNCLWRLTKVLFKCVRKRKST